MPYTPHRLLRLPAVLDAFGIGRTKLYADLAAGLVTRPVALGVHSVGWPVREVTLLVAARVAGKTDSQIRDLVRGLEADRASALDEAFASVGLRSRPLATEVHA